MIVPTYAVISTHNKNKDCLELVEQLHDATQVVVIDNASNPSFLEASESKKLKNLFVVEDSEQPPNLSRLWNIGLDYVQAHAQRSKYPEWNVAVLNDDVLLTENWLSSLGKILRESPAAVAYGDQFDILTNKQPVLHTNPGPISILERMCGYANLSKGELGIRFDESMRWWYSDDDYDWTCRTKGGSLFVPYHKVWHKSPDLSTSQSPELSQQAGIDRETFYKKWKQYPW